MKNVDVPTILVETLSRLWLHHQDPQFLGYLETTYALRLPELPVFDAIRIAEIENGEASSGEIGGIISHLWRVDEGGCRRDHSGIDFSIRGDFYVTPVVKFLAQGLHVATGEALGPSLACRRFGVVRDDGTLDLSVKWCTSRISP